MWDAMTHQHEFDEPGLAALASVMTLAIMTCIVALWWRFEVQFSRWPYRLIGLASGEKERLAGEFYSEPTCCLDANMSLRLRAMWGSSEELAHDLQAHAAFHMWARSVRLTNMEIERLFALLKQAGGSSTPYNLERFASDGYLQQHLTAHKKHGGDDPRDQLHSSVAAEGVPLAASILREKRAKELRGGVQAWWLYALEQKRAAGAKVTDYHAWKSMMARQFRDLPPEDRRRFELEAAQSRKARLASRRVDIAARSAPSGRPAEPMARTCMWGSSCATSPLAPDRFVECALARARASHPRRSPETEEGLTFRQWGASCRRAMQERVFVEDAGLAWRGPGGHVFGT